MKKKLIIAGLSALIYLPTPSLAGWLDERMGEDPIAYARLPSVHALLHKPKDTELSGLQQHQAYQKAVNALWTKIRQSEIWFEVTDPSQRLIYQTLISELTDNVEIALSLNAKNAPLINATGRVSLKKEEFYAFIQSQLDEIGFIQLNTETTPAEIVGLPLPLYVFIDESQKRFLISTENAIDINQFAKQEPSPLYQEAKQKIDPSGEGLMVFIDTQKMTILESMGLLIGGDNPMSMLMNQAEYLTAGWGFADKNAKLGAFLKVKNPILDELIPSATLENLQYSDTLKAYASFQSPSYKTLGQWVTFISMADPSIMLDFKALEKEIATNSDLSLNQIVNGLEGKWISLSDSIGDYFILNLKDETQISTIFDALEKLDLISNDTVNGITRTLIKPNFIQDYLAMELIEKEFHPQGEMLLRLMSFNEFYWQMKGNQFIASIYPQALKDRSADQSIQSWRNTQKLKTQSTLIEAGIAMPGFNQDLFYFNLSLLQGLSRAFEHDLDLRALPSPKDIKLDTQTAASQFNVIKDENHIGLTINFENTPLDVLVHTFGSNTALIVGAIISTVAMPAYKEYQLRQDNIMRCGTPDGCDKDQEGQMKKQTEQKDDSSEPSTDTQTEALVTPISDSDEESLLIQELETTVIDQGMTDEEKSVVIEVYEAEETAQNIESPLPSPIDQ